MTLNIEITYLDNNFINSSKSSKNYHIHAAYAVCGFFFCNAEIRKQDRLTVVFCPVFLRKLVKITRQRQLLTLLGHSFMFRARIYRSLVGGGL